MTSHRSFHRSKAVALLLGLLVVFCVFLRPSEASAVASSSAEEDQIDALQKEQEKDFDFFSPQYQVGVTYVQTSDLWQTSKINVAGQEIDQVMQMNMTDEMRVEDLAVGGKEVTITYTRVAMDMDSMGMKMHYDNMGDKSKNDPLLSMLGDLVGEPITMLVDDNYNVVKMDLADHVRDKLQANEATKELASPKQFEQTTRLAQTLPSIGVAEGDSWDFDLDQDMVRFTGTATLVGYNRDCGHHHKCAEIHMEGSMDMDMEEVGDVLGDDNAISAMMKDVKITQGHMSTTMMWDNQAKFARVTELKTTMTMQMHNPVDNSLMEIPIEQVVKTTVDMME